MDSVRDVLAEVWREVGRHIEIDASAQTIAAMLVAHLPLESLWVWRYDAAPPALQTVASIQRGHRAPHDAAHLVIAAEQAKRLRAWGARGDLRAISPQDGRRGFAFLLPGEPRGEVWGGPLTGTEGLIGVVLFWGSPSKPFSARQRNLAQALLEPFSAALENDRRLHELATLREAAEAERRALLIRIGRERIQEEIVGADSGLRLVMERVALVAQSDVPVMILGETGTGKEVVARAIHSRSARHSGPFIRVNCGAIPPELIDSQLFGHEKGSFTGAAEMRRGWFERADGGTLFLDEIGELPLAAQVRLLRVLQDGIVERVGGEQSLRVAVRIVAATHRNLAEMVKNGRFREDLWYRVNVFPILLPLLRERLEDIPALARHFARRAAHHFGLTYVEPTDEDVQRLRAYGWPGNIRELGAVLDRAAILGNGQSLQVAQALGTSHSGGSLASPEAAFMPVHETRSTLREAPLASTWATLDEAMKTYIERVLAATRGRVEGRHGAAAILGINPHTLRARMRKLHIDWARFRDE